MMCLHVLPFSISWNAGFLEVYSFSLLLFGKVLLSLSIVIECLIGYSSILAGLCSSLLEVFLVIPLWLVVFLLRSHLLALLGLCCMLLPVSTLVPLIVFLYICILPFKLWCVFEWASLSSSWLGPSVLPGLVWLFSPQSRELFCHYFFQQVFYPLFLLLSFWYPYYMDIIMFHVILQLP